MQEFLNMGGYGGYVWPAYLISAAVLATLSIATWRRGKNLSQRLEDAEKKSAARAPQ